MEILLTVTLKPSEAPGEADALLDAFLEVAADASPVVGEEPGKIDVTFSVQGETFDEVVERAQEIAKAGLRRAGISDPGRLLDLPHAELALPALVLA